MIDMIDTAANFGTAGTSVMFGRIRARSMDAFLAGGHDRILRSSRSTR
jgi:hypothetical protein